ncbi:MAG TPA: DUF2207 domain-containing protein, partial [Patescibacteria group bacterium]|nr:DUF2207 domain-containing protein [Patescibacteria group bacterium]
MSKFIIKTVLTVPVFFLLLVCFFVQPGWAAIPVLPLSFNGYRISSYDVHIKVNSNNILDVTETIMAHFDQEKHGIYRTIPIINTTTRVMDQQEVWRTHKSRVRNISVTDEAAGTGIPFQKKADKNNLILTIGDPGATIT